LTRSQTGSIPIYEGIAFNERELYMTKKDYILIGMTIASTIVKMKPYANIGDIIDVLDSWVITLKENNTRFDENKFRKFVTDRWLIESR